MDVSPAQLLWLDGGRRAHPGAGQAVEDDRAGHQGPRRHPHGRPAGQDLLDERRHRRHDHVDLLRDRACPPGSTAWNKKKLADTYFGKTWDRALPVAGLRGLPRPTTPPAKAGGRASARPSRTKLDGKLKAPGPDYYEAFCATPFANDWEIDFAKAAVEGEQLGQRGVTDMLAISLSATDLAGHDFGPLSQKSRTSWCAPTSRSAISSDWMHGKLGKEEVLVVLSADHGGVAMPEQMSSLGFSAGRIKKKMISDVVEKALKASSAATSRVLAAGGSAHFPRPQEDRREEAPTPRRWSTSRARPPRVEGFGGYFTRAQLLRGEVPDTELGRAMLADVLRASRRRRGDVDCCPSISGESTPSTTRAPPTAPSTGYDADVPLVFAGASVKPGKNGVREMIDLAPTLSTLAWRARRAPRSRHPARQGRRLTIARGRRGRAGASPAGGSRKARRRGESHLFPMYFSPRGDLPGAPRARPSAARSPTIAAVRSTRIRSPRRRANAQLVRELGPARPRRGPGRSCARMAPDRFCSRRARGGKRRVEQGAGERARVVVGRPLRRADQLGDPAVA